MNSQRNMTLGNRILEAIKQNWDNISAAQLADSLATPVQNINSTLSRLEKEGKIQIGEVFQSGRQGYALSKTEDYLSVEESDTPQLQQIRKAFLDFQVLCHDFFQLDSPLEAHILSSDREMKSLCEWECCLAGLFSSSGLDRFVATRPLTAAVLRHPKAAMTFENLEIERPDRGEYNDLQQGIPFFYKKTQTDRQSSGKISSHGRFCEGLAQFSQRLVPEALEIWKEANDFRSIRALALTQFEQTSDLEARQGALKQLARSFQSGLPLHSYLHDLAHLWTRCKARRAFGVLFQQLSRHWGQPSNAPLSPYLQEFWLLAGLDPLWPDKSKLMERLNHFKSADAHFVLAINALDANNPASARAHLECAKGFDTTSSLHQQALRLLNLFEGAEESLERVDSSDPLAFACTLFRYGKEAERSFPSAWKTESLDENFAFALAMFLLQALKSPTEWERLRAFFECCGWSRRWRALDDLVRDTCTGSQSYLRSRNKASQALAGEIRARLEMKAPTYPYLAELLRQAWLADRHWSRRILLEPNFDEQLQAMVRLIDQLNLMGLSAKAAGLHRVALQLIGCSRMPGSEQLFCREKTALVNRQAVMLKNAYQEEAALELLKEWQPARYRHAFYEDACIWGTKAQLLTKLARREEDPGRKGRYLAEGKTLLESLIAFLENDPGKRHELPRDWNYLGDLHGEADDFEAMDRAFQRSLELQRELHEQEAKTPNYEALRMKPFEEMLFTYQLWLRHYARRGRVADFKRIASEFSRQREALHALFPEATIFHSWKKNYPGILIVRYHAWIRAIEIQSGEIPLELHEDLVIQPLQNCLDALEGKQNILKAVMLIDILRFHLDVDSQKQTKNNLTNILNALSNECKALKEIGFAIDLNDVFREFSSQLSNPTIMLSSKEGRSFIQTIYNYMGF